MKVDPLTPIIQKVYCYPVELLMTKVGGALGRKFFNYTKENMPIYLMAVSTIFYCVIGSAIAMILTLPSPTVAWSLSISMVTVTSSFIAHQGAFNKLLKEAT